MFQRATAAIFRLRSGHSFAVLALGLLGLAPTASAQTPSFAAPTTITLNGFPATISVERLRGAAGPLDLVIPTQGGTFVLLANGTGNGNGTFTASGQSPIAPVNPGDFPETGAVASINTTTDTTLDIAVVNIISGDVSIMLGNGAGNFGAPTNFCLEPAPGVCGNTSTNKPYSVAIASINKNTDSFPDLVISNSGTNTVSVLFGNGLGGFGALLPANVYPVGSNPEGIAVADLNNDGIQDIVVTNYNNGQPAGGNNVSVLIGNANGTFQAAVPYATQAGARGVAIADLNGDLVPDLVIGTGNGFVDVLLGNGNGTFGAATDYLVGAGGLASWGVAVADFNLDGKLDVAVANNNAVSAGVWAITVLNGDGAGGLTSPGTNFTVGTSPSYLSAGDFNGDGKADLVVTNFGGGDASILLNNRPLFADLGITKTSAATVGLGANVVYTITVTNNGPDQAPAVSVADTTPAGLTFVSNTGACTTAFPCTALGPINSGASKVITSTYTVPAGYTGANPILNTATVSTSGTTDSVPGNNSATSSTALSFSTDLALTKVGPASVAAGQNVVYTITVTNNGPNTAAGVSVADTTPTGLTFVSNTGACTTAFPCAALGPMTSGQVKTITSTYTVPVGYAGANPILNTATVTPTSANTTDPTPGNNSQTSSTPVTFSADLAVTKTGPLSVNAGSNVVYTITVTNNGPNTNLALTVADTAPTGLTFVSNTGACTTAFPCNGLGPLTSGQSKTITSTFNVPAGYTGSNPILNTVTVGSTNPDTTDPTPGNNSATASTPVVLATDLTLTNTGPASVPVGQNVVYTITVNNVGPNLATAVSVADPTPAGLTFVSNSGGCTTAFPCAIGPMASATSKVITATFNVPTGYTGANPILNTATVSSSSTTDPFPANNAQTASTPVNLATDLAITKTGPTSVALGANLVYTITVTNNGPSTAGAVSVTHPTPAGLTFVSNTGACTTVFPCNALGPMTSGQVKVITSTYTVPLGYTGANPIVGTATVSTSSPNTTDPTPANNTSTTSTGVGAASADLSITKVGPAAAFRGQPVVYTITVTNNGPTDAAGVSVADPTPAGTTFVSNTGDCATAFPCSLGTVQSGASRTITATFDVPTGYAGAEPLVNTATVSATTADPDATNNTVSASVRLDPVSLSTVTPCRVIDTRDGALGALGAPALVAGATRNFTLTGTCNVPTTARAVSVNITVTQSTGQGDLQIYPAGNPAPGASSINYSAGQTRANNAVIPLGPGGAITVQVDQAAPGTVDFILDVNAYFEP